MSDFKTRPQLQARQLQGLIAVLQAADPSYNLTRHEVTALENVLQRFNIPVDETLTGAQQATASAAEVDIRLWSELQELGVPTDAPLYYQVYANGKYVEAATLYKNMTKDGFSTQNFDELWSDVMSRGNHPNSHQTPGQAVMNVDGRRTAAAVEAILNRIIAEEVGKIPPPPQNAA